MMDLKVLWGVSQASNQRHIIRECMVRSAGTFRNERANRHVIEFPGNPFKLFVEAERQRVQFFLTVSLKFSLRMVEIHLHFRRREDYLAANVFRFGRRSPRFGDLAPGQKRVSGGGLSQIV